MLSYPCKSIYNYFYKEVFLMKIQDLIIDPKSLGSNLWLVDVAPVYEYKDNRRTDNITGYRYTVAMPENGLDKINIKIDGKQLVEKPEGYAEVTFTGLVLSLYMMNNQPQVKATATGISLVNHKA